MRLNDSEGQSLVRLAREGVTTYLRSGMRINPNLGKSQALRKKSRVFVTILTSSQSDHTPTYELRGCIGFLEARYSLALGTIQAAISAATEDPRFPPVNSAEVERLVFEVNVLSELERLNPSDPSAYPSMIRIGVDGLVVSKGEYRGLLLPEVAVEWGWSAEEFLSQCSVKAGLYPDAWLDRDARVDRFQSEIFRESAPMGPVVRLNLISDPRSRP